jgi:1,4-dihydroxy-6-naphthoate synthase
LKDAKLVEQTIVKEIGFGHTPDADDAFMWFALSTDKLKTPGLKINHTLKSIQQLNIDAKEGLFEISAISFGAYPEVAARYALLPCGGCLGFGYGPMILSAKPLSRDQLRQTTIAIPGRLTTAFLTMQLFDSQLTVVEMPFDKIVSAVEKNEVGAGLIIHEAQLTYERMGFSKIVDLGEWWQEETGLPLPLGGNIIRKDLEPELQRTLAKVMQDSIRYSLANRAEALPFALQWARGIALDQADKFIGMYVNESTVDYGETGRRAITTLYDRAFDKGILKEKIEPHFIAV